MVFAALAALSLAAAPCRHSIKNRHHHPCAHMSTKDTGLTAERMLRRRVVRMAHLAYLERKQTVLAEFLQRAETETPVFRDDRRVAFGAITIGPTVVTRDFLGSAVIRARVRNDGEAAFVLITALLRSPTSGRAEATSAVNLSAHGALRTIELECPPSLAPESVEWSVIRL